MYGKDISECFYRHTREIYEKNIKTTICQFGMPISGTGVLLLIDLSVPNTTPYNNEQVI